MSLPDPVHAGAEAVPHLVVRSHPVADVSEHLLDHLPEHGGLAWVRRSDGLAGWGVAARLDVAGSNRFATAQQWWRALTGAAVVRDDIGVPGSGLVCFGSFGFTDDDPSELVVPEVIVGRRGGTTWVTTVSPASSLAAPPELTVNEPTPVGEIAFADGARSGTAWSAIVADAVTRITGGAVDKVVLARDLIAQSVGPIDLRWPLRRLAAAYPNCWTFAVDGLIGATPELLVRREKGLITSRVLAGTIRRTGDDAHDLALAASLARSSKDLEEHEFAVRSVADALEPHCKSMNVPETPFVLHLPNVMHLASDVAGVAANGASALGLAAALHPSAAVCGTPTAVARDLIEQIEGMSRGRYAGPVGWMDAAGDGEWGIALRCGQADPDDPARMRLFAGCGIVAGSDPEAELAESNAKLVPMRDALGV
ncbi:isochorismate synthase [Kribbella flavida DSM 17836]|uniref:isochorismate synthase n=1 Tax=Kribbella flavida (strain DSM 17836 / JCM 10339 / NBRC 14399) TaxID=479435 RepID=D2PVR4_KRIFD|nr:isochorismate synthase [Kribbella flavida]ADB35304.1 isochorismate synthase [Kribbella flavida DSM 17836]